MNTSNPFDLTGKIALVTGASRGIGEGIARLLAAQGAHVIVSSRKQDACEAVAASIRGEGGKAEAYACHIGEMAQIDKLFADLEAKHGRIDILINNAATNPHFGHITETDVGAFQKTVDVNIRGYFFMSSAAAKLMAKNGGGSIVNVASVNGVTPGAQQGIYSITKAAVISMTKAFARECAPQKVRVNALLPGATDTKFASALFHNPVILEQALSRIPMRRVA
ncbi:MAG TPA: SDR family oxidoreductase, partial [Noviherbaspirillum sp.]